MSALKDPQVAGRREDLWTAVDDLLHQHGLILASNRGPMEYHIQDGGAPVARRGSGGVVTALSGLTNHVDFTWIASAMGEGDRRIAAEHGGQAIPVTPAWPTRGSPVRYHLTPRLPQVLQHHLQSAPLVPPALHVELRPTPPTMDRRGPRRLGDRLSSLVNRGLRGRHQSTEAAVKEQRTRPLVILHDYHLYLVPGMVRAATAAGAYRLSSSSTFPGRRIPASGSSSPSPSAPPSARA